MTLLDNDGPLTADELGTGGHVLALLERRGFVEPVFCRGNMPAIWSLTIRGTEEARRARKSYLDWLRARPPLTGGPGTAAGHTG